MNWARELRSQNWARRLSPQIELATWARKLSSQIELRRVGSPGTTTGSAASTQQDRIRKSQNGRSTLNWDRVQGNWKQVTGKVKEQWGNDIAQINGNREQLEGGLQARYGYAKDQAKKNVDDWLGRMWHRAP
jgi:uncharacterized protein YjbJ (UPF0337 family)